MEFLKPAKLCFRKKGFWKGKDHPDSGTLICFLGITCQRSTRPSSTSLSKNGQREGFKLLYQYLRDGVELKGLVSDKIVRLNNNLQTLETIVTNFIEYISATNCVEKYEDELEPIFDSTRNRIKTESDHTLLPSVCTVDKSGCSTGEGTFIWYLPSNQCQLEIVRTILMTRYRGYLVNTENWILLKKLNPLPSPSNCPNVLTYTSQYTDLF